MKTRLNENRCKHNNYKLILFMFVIIIINPININAQTKRIDSLITRYHRNSIYTIILKHPGYVFGNEIEQEFLKIPISDKYNEHNLSVRSMSSNEDKNQQCKIEEFFNRNFVSKRLVSKWFDRDKDSGSFDMNLIWQRGCYDATEADYQIAKHSIRGKAMIADAGEELIGNTYVIVNDIRYIDKEERAQKTKLTLKLVSAFAGGVAGYAAGDTKDLCESISSMADAGADISELIAGFRVKVTSYLYKLEWTNDYASKFYLNYYISRRDVDSVKKAAYENDSNIFRLNYIGQYSAKSGKTVLRGLKSNEEVIKKVCARALDENIIKLQKKFEPFKVKSPIYKIIGDTIYSPIGLKEGVTLNSKFEVLEANQDEYGKTKYKRVGIIKPYRKKIWDNRFMAIEEESNGSDLKYTAFKKVIGSDFTTGLLLRQIK